MEIHIFANDFKTFSYMYILLRERGLDMNILSLKYAIEVERAGSISGAAANLFVAQPNLSKLIKDLEKELGYKIFARTSSGIKITDKGEQFLYHARKMLEQMSEIEKIANKNAVSDRRFKLSIPRGSYIANGFTEFVADLDMGENLKVTINETNAIKTIENVADRDYNMGIIRYPVSEESFFVNSLKNNHLSSETIWEFDYVLVMGENHPLSAKEEISAADLEKYVQITHGDIESPVGGIKSPSTEDGHLSGKVIYVYERGSQFDLLANVPDTYMWVSPIPECYLTRNHLVQRSCKVDNNRYKDVLIYRDDYELSENDKLFQKKIYESKVEVSTQKII